MSFWRHDVLGEVLKLPVPRWEMLPSEFAPHERVLPVILARQAQKYPAKDLLVFGSERWSYEDAVQEASRAAHSLLNAGIGKGDRVAIVCSNRPEFLKIFLGCAWIGAVAVPINIAMRGQQLAHVFQNSSPKLLVIEQDLLPALASVSDHTILPPCAWIIGDRIDGLPGHISASLLPTSSESAAPADIEPGETVAILYTSGTTGPSKGVCCPQAQLFWWGVCSARALQIQEGEVLITTLPLFHTNALNAFYQAMLNGCTYVLLPKFSASRFWGAVREYRANVIYLLGAMAAILLAQPEKQDDKNHCVRVGLGGGVPERFHARFLNRFNIPLVDGYASTETNFVFSSAIPSDHPGSMGYLSGGAEARIVDRHDAPLKDGEAGELILRSSEPYLFASGYFNMPEKTVEAWRNLWFHTGDRVVRHPDGHYEFIDRIKDSVRRRGENISSWEVEQVLLTHPAIASCAIYAVPSELGEDDVAAALQLKEGCSLSPEEFVSFCEGKLATFAVPRFLRFVAELPLTENGKIKKVVLRDAGKTDDMWDREAPRADTVERG